jgi:hypothetical protein
MASKLTSIVAEEVVPRNTMRKSFVVQNEDAADSIFLKRERAETPTVSATDHDHRIGPGGAVALNDFNDGKQAVQDRWTCVASANTPRISFFETEDVVR